MKKTMIQANYRQVVLGALLGVGSLLGAVAAQAADLKVAVFDPQLIYAQSTAAKRAGDQLKAKQDQANTQIAGLEKPLEDKQKALASQQSLLSADKLKSQQDDLRKDYLAYRGQAAKISGDFEKAQFDARKTIADAMKVVVEDLAKQKGYDLVLPKGIAFYNSAAVTDISQDVLTGVNARLK